MSEKEIQHLRWWYEETINNILKTNNEIIKRKEYPVKLFSETGLDARKTVQHECPAKILWAGGDPSTRGVQEEEKE